MPKILVVLLFTVLSTTINAAPSVPKDYIPLDQAGAPSNPRVEAEQSGALFEVARGASLRQTLGRWSRIAGWQDVVWQLPEDTDFSVGASARFQGDFVGAIRSLMAAIGPETNIRVRVHYGNNVLVVEQLQ
jgi:hypothetical protein